MHGLFDGFDSSADTFFKDEEEGEEISSDSNLCTSFQHKNKRSVLFQ